MKTCPVCGKPVPRGHGHKTTTDYCSKRCSYARNYPPKTEIINELNRTDNITVTAQLFGTERQTMYRWMRYYGIKRKVVYEG